jgi:hypothetical protein
VQNLNFEFLSIKIYLYTKGPGKKNLNIRVLLHIFGPLTRVSTVMGKTFKCMVLSKYFPINKYMSICA